MRALMLAVLMLAAGVESANAVDWHGPNLPHYDDYHLHYERPRTCRIGWEWVLVRRHELWHTYYGLEFVTVWRWEERRVVRCR